MVTAAESALRTAADQDRDEDHGMPGAERMAVAPALQYTYRRNSYRKATQETQLRDRTPSAPKCTTSALQVHYL